MVLFFLQEVFNQFSTEFVKIEFKFWRKLEIEIGGLTDLYPNGTDQFM